MQSQHLIEPHAPLLNKPNEDSHLYKVILFRNFNDMINRNYLYFNRVDTYNDDIRDSDPPDKDKKIFREKYFEKSTNYNLYDYYKNCRSRTYACCFSLEGSSHIWKYGDACIVFNSSKLINYLNNNYKNSKIQFENECLKNIFFINYGLVKYGSLKNDILSNPTLPNPITCAYFKDSNFSKEKEFRITLSCFGLGKFIFKGLEFTFPKSLELAFDFITGIQLGIITEIIVSEENLFKEISALLSCYRLIIRLNTE
jgi:hypothetical protein